MEHIRRAKFEGCYILPSVYPAPSTSTGPSPRERQGNLVVTPHHLFFTANDTGEETWIPHSLLQHVTLYPPSVTSLAPITLRTFVFETYTLLFRDTSMAQELFDSLKGLLTSTTLSSAYAFCATEKAAGKTEKSRGWCVYDPQAELARMGVGGKTSRSEAWRWSEVNKEYEFCSTYPAHLAVPAKISDVTLRYGKTYRSKHRVPALVYLHRTNLGSITRASQPMVGLKNARSIQDEKLIEAIFHSHAQHSTNATKQHHAIYGARATNLIIDARPTTNAMANVAKGAGTENMEHYKDCKKAYLGVDNIHVMRDSLKSVTEVLREADQTGFIDRTALRKSGWLKHTAAILDGVVLIARNVHLANSHVLVHCSDGWDRTSQLSSLAQICLDPYYRTIEGFAVLVEKDWVSFGHKFADRAGHFVKDRAQLVVSAGDNQTAQQAILANVQRAFQGGSHAFKETSPVFPQFLDCVYQMLRQFPGRFEFGEGLLLKLHYHLYSCRYGSFLYNSEQERKEGVPIASETTDSVWDIFLDDKREWLNPDYDPSLDAAERSDADLGVILPDPKAVAFWPAFFRRTEEELNGSLADPEIEDSEPPPPEIVGPIDNAPDDPVLSLVDGIGRSRSPSTLPRSGSLHMPSSPRAVSNVPNSPSESNLGRFSSTAAPQLQSAYASVMRFGGSTFKTLRKSYEEVVKDFNAATSGPEESQENKPLPPLDSNPWATESEASRDMSRHSSSNGLNSKREETSGVYDGRRNPWATADQHARKPSQANGKVELHDALNGLHLSDDGNIANGAPSADDQSNQDPLGVGL